MERFDLGDRCWLTLWRAAVPDGPRAWLEDLCRELPLARELYRMLGREIASPRLVSYHGDADAAYRYSGVLHRPRPWTALLGELRQRVEQISGLRFNAVLANLYRDGDDSMGYHADAEPEIGPSPDDRWIGSLSFGARRRFVMRHRQSSLRRVFELGAGDLLVMRGATQSHWRHALPKTRRPVGPRLNLTFRRIVRPPGATGA